MRSNRSRRLIAAPAVVMALALTLAACGGGSEDAATVAPAGQSAAERDATQPEEDAAPTPAVVAEQMRFTATAVDGSSIDGVALASKPTVAWFWTPWCTICRKESGTVSSMAAKFGDRINVVGIAGKGSVEDMNRFVSDTGVGGFKHAVDADGGLWSRFGVIGQPSFAFVNTDGSVDVVPGVLSERDLDKRIADMLQA